MSDAFLSAFLNFSDSIKRRVLTEKSTESVLRLAQVFGDILMQNHCGTYFCEEVESFIESTVINDPRFISPKISLGGGTVLLATALYDYGGHTRVVMNWLDVFKSDGDHRLIVKDSVQKEVLKKLDDADIPYYICKNDGVLLINELCLNIGSADRIVLHIHPFDIVSAVVARILSKLGKDVIFYNHLDNVFSYGIWCSSVVCEISTFGSSINQRTGRAKHAYHLGLPVNFDKCTFSGSRGKEGSHTKVILSGGAPHKYRPESLFFGDFIDELFKCDDLDVNVYLVGPDGSEDWWSGYTDKWGEKVKFFGLLSNEDYLQLLEKCDVYIDSFPMTGGIAFPLALLHGKPCAGLKTPVQGYSAIDSLRVESIPDLVTSVGDMLNGVPECLLDMEVLRRKIIQFNAPDSFKNRVKEVYAMKNSSEGVPDIPVDSYWFENRWKDEQEIILPFGGNVRTLKPNELVFFLMRVVAVSRYIKSRTLIGCIYHNLIKGSIKRMVRLIGLRCWLP